MNKLMKSPKNLILYKDFENGKLFYNMTWIMENYENEYYNKEDVESLLYQSLKQLMELAVSHGFEGNLWHSFLAFILVNNEKSPNNDPTKLYWKKPMSPQFIPPTIIKISAIQSKIFI